MSAPSGCGLCISMPIDLSTKRPSDRKFGFTFSVILIVTGAYGLYAASWRPILTGLCALAGASLLVFAAIAPRLLSPLNKAWFAFGELLGGVVSPIVLGVIFFALITPVSVIARVLGRDELRLKRGATSSYWVQRRTVVPEPNSFKRQF